MLEVRQADGGGWIALVHGARMLAVEAGEIDDGQVRTLWAGLGDAADLSAVLELLARDGLGNTPPFVLVQWQADGSDAVDIQSVVRGRVALSVDTADGVEDVDAAGASTWLERSTRKVTGFSVEPPALDDARGGWLPLADGAVRMAGVRFRAADENADATRALPRRRPAASQAPAAPTAPPASPEPAAPDAAPARPTASAPVTTPTAVSEETISEAPTETSVPSGTSGSGQSPVDDATAVRPREGETTGSAGDPPQEVAGDHDGMTVFSGDLRRMRREAEAAGPATASDDDSTAQPQATDVRYVLELPGGAVEPIEHTVLLGRAPRVTGAIEAAAPKGPAPRLITIAGEDQDISRTHLRFVLEGDTVVVTDMHSRNGTIIVLPGKAPQKLRAGEPTSVIAGTVVDLGGGVHVTVRPTDA